MFDVFALSAPLKIIDVIIEWIAINMIYLRLLRYYKAPFPD